jgi:crossover junction endodeoxyribonuclease RuvC
MDIKDQIILGVDPGFHVTGFAIIKISAGKTSLCDWGILKMRTTDSLSDRVGQFHTFFTEKISRFAVTQIALETSFLGKNAQTFLKLGYLRGILYLLASQHALGLTEFAPTQVKSTVTGHGGASKEQVATLLFRFFPALNNAPAVLKLDMTDALAIALCGAWYKKTLLAQVQASSR